MTLNAFPGDISAPTHTLLTFDIAISISCVCSQGDWSETTSIVHIGREMAPQDYAASHTVVFQPLRHKNAPFWPYLNFHITSAHVSML